MKNDEILKELCRLKNQVNDLIKVVDNRFAKECADNADATTDVEDAVCDMDVAFDERMTAIEDALCELDTKGV